MPCPSILALPSSPLYLHAPVVHFLLHLNQVLLHIFTLSANSITTSSASSTNCTLVVSSCTLQTTKQLVLFADDVVMLTVPTSHWWFIGYSWKPPMCRVGAVRSSSLFHLLSIVHMDVMNASSRRNLPHHPFYSLHITHTHSVPTLSPT